MMNDHRPVEIRPVGLDELDSAIDLVAASIAEIPLYRWLLGPHIDDAEVRQWMSNFFLARHVPLGRVEGAITADGEVFGVVVWTAPDNPSPPLPAQIQEETSRVLPTRPDIVERLQQLSSEMREHDGFEDCVDLPMVVVAPHLRRSGIPARLGLRARQAAVDGGYGIAMTTTDRALGDAHQRTYGAKLEQSYPLGPLTVDRYRMSPEQARDWTPREQRTHASRRGACQNE